MKWSVKPLGIGLLTLALIAIGSAVIHRSFVLHRDAQPSGAIGPFLQQPTPEAVTVRWRSDTPEPSQVAYRALDETEWTLAGSGEASQDHAVRLSGLRPNTRYDYRLSGPDSQDRQASFDTPPPVDDPGPHRIWILGDPGVNNPATHAVRDSSLTWMAANPHRDGDHAWPDFILTSGDNAYPSGRDRDYRDCIFTTYANVLPFIPIWPAHGNHDARRDAYRRIFDLPVDGESGGEASGSEFYWAF
ncbi:MAG: fibronectin type III domain-containing protein, partial [Pseudomonadota bacterium]